jgi:hypothetical protein
VFSTNRAITGSRPYGDGRNATNLLHLISTGRKAYHKNLRSAHCVKQRVRRTQGATKRPLPA